MNIEEAIETLNELKEIFRSPDPFKDDKDYDRAEAIETLLTAYEKEKELLELAFNMLDNIDYDQIPIAIGELKSELEKEKEKNKEFIKQHVIEITDVGGNSIKIDLDGKIHNVYKIEEE